MMMRPMQEKQLNCDVLVIGSGPGGVNTAYLLAKAGKNVILAEEGPNVAANETKAFSLDEMQMKYRNGGITAALGKTKVAYLEPCCVGGGSEINAGLYHYPIPELIQDWQRDFKIQDFML